MKSTLLRPFASYIRRRLRYRSALAVEIQEEIRKDLVRTARDTAFGRDHHFDEIRSYPDFRRRIPIGDYEAFKPYADRIKLGEPDVSWPGVPKYLAKTSGTTSGVKYIPLTRDSLPNHFGSARNALFNYVAETGHARWLDGKMIFLSGSPEMDSTNGIPTGRLSGIVNHEVPAWLRTNQLPSYATNCIEDWETKLEAIVEETIHADMRLISGIPPWVQMYYERLLARSGKATVKELFPNLDMFVYGGVNFEPYRESLERLVGARIPSVETYPASEGFIAFQDSQTEPGLLLNTGSGIFFEFVPAEQVSSDRPERLSLAEVKMGVNYALLLSSTAGLWAYDIGDTVEFVSLDPYRIRVTGRVKHYISAFGEHVIGKEVETALRSVAGRYGAEVTEFTVAPQVNPVEGLPYHEWLVEFSRPPADAAAFSAALDRAMVEENLYYRDLIQGKILRPLVLTALPTGAFRRFMKQSGKLGGQNKVPRLANDRKIADALLEA
ncbi:GH3 auxin-responsive promoter family protein [Neolewinella xylanilytica]|uniref:GH3 auxin-responsive promoter family protein n=1 Tax=Neolewinella xylanilytica TaxID=1514080 RepID=UPI000CEAEA45